MIFAIVTLDVMQIIPVVLIFRKSVVFVSSKLDTYYYCMKVMYS